MTHKDGKPKGIAFVDFDTEASAQKCVASGDKLMLRERELEVALSNPPVKKDKSHGKPAAIGASLEEDGPRKGHAAKLQLVPRAISKYIIFSSQLSIKKSIFSKQNSSNHCSAGRNGCFRRHFNVSATFK